MLQSNIVGNFVKIRDSEAQFIDYVQEIKDTSAGNVHLPNIAKNALPVVSKDQNTSVMTSHTGKRALDTISNSPSENEQQLSKSHASKPFFQKYDDPLKQQRYKSKSHMNSKKSFNISQNPSNTHSFLQLVNEKGQKGQVETTVAELDDIIKGDSLLFHKRLTLIKNEI